MTSRTSLEVHSILCAMVKQIRSRCAASASYSTHDTDYFIVDHWNSIHACATQMYQDYAKSKSLHKLQTNDSSTLYSDYLSDIYQTISKSKET